jgi:hypothetical protein
MVQEISPAKCTLVTLKDSASRMQLADRVAAVSPAMVVLSHLPPDAFAQASY